MKSLTLSVLLCMSCASVPTPGPVVSVRPTFPTYRDLLPPDTTPPKPTVSPSAFLFPDKAIMDKACGGPGVLVDEKTYVEMVWAVSRVQRLSGELHAMRALQEAQGDAFKTAEGQYTQWIAQAQKKLAEPPSVWERLQFPIGFAIGAALVVGTTYAVKK